MSDARYDARRSLGFVWNLPAEGLHIQKADNAEDALFTFHKYRVEHVSKTLRTLEHIPCTYAQTRTILDGKAVAGLSTRQLRAVENYGAACELLVDMLEQGRFGLNAESVCALHAVIGKDEAKHVGRFRGHEVMIEQSHYAPSKAVFLNGIFSEGSAFLASLGNAQEQAVCTFLFMARSQFFSDCNKRTANLVMNGLLMQNGFQPLSLDSEHFLERMTEFYETADATRIIAEINTIAKRQYQLDDTQAQSQKIQEEHQHLLETALSYTEQFKMLVLAKEGQAMQLESRIEAVALKQRDTVATTRAMKPGAVASLWKGAAWEKSLRQRQSRLEVLEKRLSRVRGIRTGMAGKRLEEFARKKLQRADPELVAKHDAQQRQLRERQAEENLRLTRERSGHRRRDGDEACGGSLSRQPTIQTIPPAPPVRHQPD